MTEIRQRVQQVRTRIKQAARRFGRDPMEIRLLAVSKTHPAERVAEAFAAGQGEFGESYLQEAVEKIAALADKPIVWHYIGRIQSNKTRAIAEHFHWVHSIDQEKQARRLNEQRPAHLPPLNVCLQVKVDDEQSKGGLDFEQTRELVAHFAQFPRLRLRGLMTLPAPREGEEKQRPAFARLRRLRAQLATPQQPLETLSLGMSGDLEAAIAEGSTLVRVGTAIFGPRNPKP